MIFVILEAAAAKGELVLVDGGLCRFGRKRDGNITLHELIVLPSHRGKGVASKIIATIRTEHPYAELRWFCPVKYKSNDFFRKIGCVLKGVKTNGKGTVSMNEWMLPPLDPTAEPEHHTVTAPVPSFTLFKFKHKNKPK